MAYDFSLSELENSPQFKQSSFETQKSVVREYIAQNGPDEALKQFNEAIGSPDFAALAPDQQQTFRQSYRDFYGVDLPTEKVSLGTDIKDVALAGLAGTSAIPKAASIVAGWFGADDMKSTLQDIAKTTEDFYRSKMSAQGKEVEQQPFLSEQDGKWFGDNAIKKVFMVSAESLPLMVATAPIGGGASAALSKAKFLPEFIRAVEGGSKTGKWAHDLIAFGGSEAGTSALVSAADAGQKIQNADERILANSPVYQALLEQGLDPAAARAELRGIVEEETVKTQFAATLAGSTLAPGGAMPKLFQKSGKAGLVRETLGGIKKEMGEEGLQSPLEQIGQNITTQRTLDPSQPTLQGAGEAMALGMASAGVTGGAFGGGSKLLTLGQAQQIASSVPIGANPEQTAAAINAAVAPTETPRTGLGDLTPDEIDGIAAVQQRFATADLPTVQQAINETLPRLRENNPAVAAHVEPILAARLQALQTTPPVSTAGVGPVTATAPASEQPVPATEVPVEPPATTTEVPVEPPLDLSKIDAELAARQSQANQDDLMDDFADSAQSVQDQADTRGRNYRFEQLKQRAAEVPVEPPAPTAEVPVEQLAPAAEALVDAPISVTTPASAPQEAAPTVDVPSAQATTVPVQTEAGKPVVQLSTSTQGEVNGQIEGKQEGQGRREGLLSEPSTQPVSTAGAGPVTTTAPASQGGGNQNTQRQAAEEVPKSPTAAETDQGTSQAAPENTRGLIATDSQSIAAGQEVNTAPTPAITEWKEIPAARGTTSYRHKGGAVIDDFRGNRRELSAFYVRMPNGRDDVGERFVAAFDTLDQAKKFVENTPPETLNKMATKEPSLSDVGEDSQDGVYRVKGQPSAPQYILDNGTWYRWNGSRRVRETGTGKGSRSPRELNEDILNGRLVKEYNSAISVKFGPEAATDRAAQSIAAGQEVNTTPTPAQADAGNYRKAHVTLDGMNLSIENPVGSTRSGTDDSGRAWSQELKADYGYIRGTQGKDKDHLDIFVKPGYAGGAADVFVVNQFKKDGTFDEHKTVVGVANEQEALDLYNANYEAGWTGGRSVTRVPVETFRKWAAGPGPKRGPLVRQGTVNVSVPAGSETKPSQPVTSETKPNLFATDSTDNYRVALAPVEDRPASHLKYRIEMAAKGSEEWYPAMMGYFQNPKNAVERFLMRYRGNVSKVEAVDPALKTALEKHNAEAEDKRKKQLAESDARAAEVRQENDLRARFEAVVSGLKGKFQKQEYQKRMAEGQSPETGSAMVLGSLGFEKIGKVYQIVHPQTGLTIAGFTSATSARRFVLAADHLSVKFSTTEEAKPFVAALRNLEQAFKGVPDEKLVQQLEEAQTPPIPPTLAPPPEKPGLKKGDKITFERGGRKYTETILQVLPDGTYGVELFGTMKYIKPREIQNDEGRRGLLDEHRAVVSSVNNGSITVEKYRQAFEDTITNRANIIADLQQLTKDQLLSMMGPTRAYRYKNDKKDAIVRSAYLDMLDDFNLTDSLSFAVGGGNYEQSMIGALRDKVNAVTEQSLSEYAASVKAAEEKLAESKAAAAKGMEDPKTIDDFVRVMRAMMEDGKTYPEARMMLTPEQRETYDRLSGEKSRGERKARADQQKTEIRTAAVSTEGEIVETKHTKTGGDLFVVKAAERVDREIYNQWNATAKRLGGYYSSFRGRGAVPGFQFKTKENAQAFLDYIGGNAENAKTVAKERRDAFTDNKEQSAVERLREMAEALNVRAEESLSRDRLANTSRLARMAVAAEAAAESDRALAKTMGNIADAIESGKANFLDRVRQKVQVEALRNYVNQAKYKELSKRYPAYVDYEKHKGEPPTKETADYADFPRYTAFRSDLAKLGRQLQETQGTKQLGKRLLEVADDVTDVYVKFAKDNLLKVSGFVTKDGGLVPAFKTLKNAEESIDRSGYRGKAIAIRTKPGEIRIVLSPSEAKARGIWKGDDDKRIILSDTFGEELIAKASRKDVEVPWYFDSVRQNKARLKGMGIETPQEFRAALREFITLQQQPAKPDRIKELERSMVGRKNDGLDFFPTPTDTAQTMVDTAGIKGGMTVLEPSAGMGHIAEVIRDSGFEPDVVEVSSSRRELLDLKGFNVVGQDFLDLDTGYDRIIMNPPFSDRRDVEHVRHAYRLLNPGGRLVAIMGEGSFFGSDKKATEFRAWLEELGGTSEKLEEGTFQDKSLPVNTGVAARMVVIDKPSTAPRLSHTTTTTGPTADIRAEITERLGSDDLFTSGTVTVISPEEAGKIAGEPFVAAGLVQGITTADGKVYLVEGNIASGRAWSVLLHELGTHAGRLMTNEKEWQQLAQAIERRRGTDSLLQDAYARVPDDTGLIGDETYDGLSPERKAEVDALRTEEAIAYLVENHPDVGIVRRVIALVKRMLVKMGMSPERFTATDLRALAESAVRRRATGGMSYVERLSRRIARLHKGETRVLSADERNQRRDELRDAGFYDGFGKGDSGVLLRPEDGEVGYSDATDRGSSDRKVNFDKWFGNSLAEIDGVPMVFWQSSETFGTGGAETFIFDDSFLGSNVPHPRAQFGPTFTPLREQARFYKGETRGFYLRLENPLILKYADTERRFHNQEDAIAFVNRMENLEGYDSIVIPEMGFVHIFQSNQAKLINNSGAFGPTGDVRFSVAAPPSPTQTPPDRIDRFLAAHPAIADLWERFLYGIVDTNDPRRRVMQRAEAINVSENLSENTDILTIERLRGKKTAEEVKRFMDDTLEPMLRDLARAKLAPADLDEYAHAKHAPERNLRMQQVNAKRFIDLVATHLNSAEREALDNRIIDIRSDVLMTGGTRADRQNQYLDVLAELFDGIDAQRTALEAEQTALDNRQFTPAEIAKGTPDNLQKRVDSRSRHLDEIEKVRNQWELESPRFAGITNDEAADIVTKWEADPRFEAMTKAHQQLLNFGQMKLDILRESGQLSDAEYKSLTDGYEFYVPLHRDVGTDDRPVTGRVTGPTGKPIKVAKGSMLEVVHILAHSVQNIQTAINRKHKADAGRVLLNFAKENPDAGISVTEQTKKPTHDAEGNIVMYVEPREGDNELYIRVDGKRYTLTFDTKNETTKRFLESIKDSDSSLGGPMQALSKMVRFLASVNTTLSPEFIFSNFLRDIQTAGVHLEDTDAKGLQAKVLKNVFPAIKGILGAEYGKANTYWSRVYRDFAANGGKIGWMQSYDGIKDLAGQIESTMNLYKDGHIPKKALHIVLSAVERTNTAVENGVRLAVYDQLIKSGAAPSKAALTAANLTVDFTRRGAQSPALNALYMFFNAGVQGNVRMIKAFARSDRIKAITVGIVATGAALQMLAYATGGDDETGQPYVDGIPDFIRERNMIIMKPESLRKDGEVPYFKIPMPYGYNLFFNTGAEIARAFHDATTGRKYEPGKAATRILTAAMGTFNPLQSATLAQALSPTVLDPVVQVAENKNWSGTSLMPEEPDYGPGKANAYRHWKSVSPVAKSIAQGLHRLTGGKGEYDNTAVIDVSPEVIEMMYETITGSAGRFVKDFVSTPVQMATSDEPIKSEKIPLFRRVYGQWTNRSITDRYYEEVDKVERFKKDFLLADAAGRKEMSTDPRYKMVNLMKDAETRLSKLREAKNKAEKAGRPTKTIDDLIIATQTEYLKRSAK